MRKYDKEFKEETVNCPMKSACNRRRHDWAFRTTLWQSGGKSERPSEITPSSEAVFTAMHRYPRTSAD